MPLPPAWRRLHSTRFAALPEDCGNTSNPGVVYGADLRDWSDKVTTEDQHRMERYIDRFDLRSSRVLHVGIGNSGLAKRFAGRVREIVGTTIDDPEIEVARIASIPGYMVVKHNKYAGQGDLLPDEFDFILDNNFTSPCCCLSHLATMLDMYAEKLSGRGQIVTDQQGLGWIPPGANPRWSFDFDDVAAIAEACGLRATKVSSTVYILSRGEPARPGVASRIRNVVRQIGWLPGRAIRRLLAAY